MFTYLMAAVALAAADSVVVLDDVIENATDEHSYRQNSSLSSIQISSGYIATHASGSLMQTLEHIPGVQAMSIGSGQSRPAIRGLGFNRMVVTENGIKHEGQQWGDDHGLEIDQFGVDRIEVLKGPAALMCGSDAIGGAINLYSNNIPTEKLTGAVQFIGRTVNDQWGASAKIGGRTNRIFYRLHTTWIDYADSRVPTDSIQYYSYYIKLHNGKLRNTAGKERDASVMFGYLGDDFHTDLRVSDTYAKSGFFANAHGLEVRLSDTDYDSSARDIDLPYQWVNHFKAHSHTTLSADGISLNINAAFQRNVREEHSEPVSHGYMPTPANSLECRFSKNTITATAVLRGVTAFSNEYILGISTEHQHNKRDGWGFIIPDFKSNTFGVYLYHKRHWGLIDLLLPQYAVDRNIGIRFDHSAIDIERYNDWYPTPTTDGDSVYVQRSANIRRKFNSVTWSWGINIEGYSWDVKANIGKSFRMPIAKELCADGINYHIFRYEKGNRDLKAERSYQVDLSIVRKGSYSDRLEIKFEPYFNYFPNYIYLSPTADYAEGMQLYSYKQARVLRYGFEAEAEYSIIEVFTLKAVGEYLYAKQLSGDMKGYSLPFSTPWSVETSLSHGFSSSFVSVSTRFVGKQDRIVPPEKTTDSYWTLNASAMKIWRTDKMSIELSAQANNLLNKRYYNHTSYYRLIDVPEAGRNFTVVLGVDF